MSRKPKHKHAAGVPHLLRQRGGARHWYGWINGREVSLRTADAQVAHQRLLQLATPASERGGAAQPPQAASATATSGMKLATLAASFSEYVQPPRHTPKTAAKYEASVLRFVEWAEKENVTHVDAITFPLISKFVRSLSTCGCGPASCNRHVSSLSSLLRYAVAEGHVTGNPLEGAALRRLWLREPRPRPDATTLTGKQVDAIVAKAKEICHPAYAAFIEATAGSGARLDEIRHIDLADLDEAKGYLTIGPKPGWVTKNYRYRNIPVSAGTIAAVKVVVARRKEAAMDDRALWGQIDLVRQKLPNVPKFAWHDLRRAWASSMHAAGASLKRVSYWLGHSGIQVTERYIRLNENVGGHEFLPR